VGPTARGQGNTSRGLLPEQLLTRLTPPPPTTNKNNNAAAAPLQPSACGARDAPRAAGRELILHSRRSASDTNQTMRSVVATLLVMCAAIGSAPTTALSFDLMFTGGAVLLQEKPVAVWGTGAKGEVSVQVDGKQVATTSSDGAGNWKVYIPPQPTSWRAKLKATSGFASVEVSVSFGIVVLCSGQSNMQMPVNHWKDGGFSALNGTAEAAAAGRYQGKIKLLTLQTPFPRPTPMMWNGTTCPGWPHKKPGCEPHAMWNDVFPGPNGTVHGFSAICWYTGDCPLLLWFPASYTICLSRSSQARIFTRS
jgi:hypothetical protein